MTVNNKNKRAVLLIHCCDSKGIVAKITDFIFNNDGNIIYMAQHVDSQCQAFFMRVEWDLTNFRIPCEKIADYFQTLVANTFKMQFSLYFSDKVARMAIFVSKLSHCLYDILSRTFAGDWQVEIPLIISNHADLQNVAKHFGIDYVHLPVSEKNKNEVEQKHIDLLSKYKIDFIVLARYMQILTPEILRAYANRIINIHHSFLPAFPGAKPYHQAHERGVKIIGATSHYVTQELDAGPIIVQDVAHVSHKDEVPDLIRKGKDLEKMVLSAAIWNHLQHKVLVYANRTVVFD